MPNWKRVIVSGSDATLNSVEFNTTPNPIPQTQGSVYWDEDNLALAAKLNGYIMTIGEDQFYPVKNQTGNNIPKGTAVQFAGTVGMSGRLLISPFTADGQTPSSFFMGVTAEDIADGADGKVLWFGRIRGIDTNAFNEGDILYASTTTPGAFQTTVPQAPNNIIQVAAVITKSATVGTIFVRPTLGSNINKDEGVKITSPSTGNILQLQSNGLWENKTLQDAGIQPTLTNPTTGTGTTNFISKFTGASTLGDSQIFDNGTNVGIGTTSPNAKLDVSADILVNSITVGRGAGDIGTNTSVGLSALQNNTTGASNTAVGRDALVSNTTGTQNTSVGRDTLLNNTTGGSNTAIGQNPLRNNTTGTSNTAIGRNSLLSNTTGVFNTAVGRNSLLFNTTGGSNTAVGPSALQSNTTGFSNIAVGRDALRDNTTGGSNIGLGNEAGRRISNGNNQNITNNSIFIGRDTRALADNQTNQIVIGHTAVGLGSNSVVLGNDSIVTTALKGNVGIGTTSPQAKLDVSADILVNSITVGRGAGDINNNTAVGLSALQNNTTGASNTAVGRDALFLNTTGTQNTAVGREALLLNTTGAQNTAIGRNSLFSNTTGAQNTAIGRNSLFRNTTGGSNIGLGHDAGRRISNGNNQTITNNSIFIGQDTRALADNQTNQIVIGHNSIGLGSNTVVLGNDSIVTTALKGNVGIGTTSPGAKVHILQNDTSTTSGTIIEQSGNGDAILQYLLTGVRRWVTGIDNSDSQKFKIASSIDLNTDARLTIDTSGNVGIGTTLPSERLHVEGKIRIGTQATATTDAVRADRTLTAGNGLTGGGNLTANRTFTLGTPSSITLSSTNSVSTSSHTHAFEPGGTTSQYLRGDGSLATFPTIPTVNNPTITLSAGTVLSGGGTFTLNQASGTTITFNHSNVTRSNTVSTTSPGFGGTVDVISSVSSSAQGHTTGTNTLTITIPTLPASATRGEISLANLINSSSSTLGFISGRRFVAGWNDLHPTGGTSRTMTGASVLSGITIDSNGHVTATAVRNLTPGDIGAQAALTNPVTGTGTTNFLSKFTGATTLGNSLVFDNGTNVGIGTTSPNAKLDVSEDIRVNSITIGRGAGNIDTNTAVGTNALFANTTGGSNTAVGRFALFNNTTGIRNTAVGPSALFSNTTGTNNIAVGQNALFSNTTGIGNTAVGQNALLRNTTGGSNIGLGFDSGRRISNGNDQTITNNSIFIGRDTRALADNQTNQIVIGHTAVGLGSNSVVLGNDSIVTTALKGNVGIGTTSPSAKLDVSADILVNGITVGRGAGNIDTNTAVGLNALSKNTTGFQNTAVGENALISNTTGNENTAIGRNSLFSNTTGDNNTAVGTRAGAANTTGEKNTYIGVGTGLNNSTGNRNNLLGEGAASAATGGDDNVVLGYEAGVFVNAGTTMTSATQSILIGNFTRVRSSGETNQIVIGHDAVGGGSNTIVLGNTSITSTSLRGNISINDTLAITSTRLGRFGNGNASTPAYSFFGDPDTGMYRIGANILGFSTNGTERLRITSAGAMGLNRTPTNTQGRFEASNDIVAFASSDIRWKTNITPLQSPLEKIHKIQGVRFDWIEDEPVHGNKGHDIGVIAQEIEQILPEIVDTRDSGMKAVKYEKLIPLLIEGIKELSKEVTELKSKLNSK